MFSLIISLMGSFICGTCLLVIGVQNPVHTILLLISVFFLGTLLLFFIQSEYFASLFLIVYVGAIVVLFLFMISSLELKMVNVVSRLRDLFSFRHLIHGFLVIEVFFIMSQDFFDLTYFFSDWSSISKYEVTNHFIEANNFMDWSKLLQRTDHLRALGGLLYTQYKITLLMAAILLFLSSVGALVLTLSMDSTNKNTLIINSINNSNNSQTIKSQDANHQVSRQPNLLFY